MVKQLARLVVAVLTLVGVAPVFAPVPVALAACTNPASTYGSVTVNYNLPTAGTYRVWSRIEAPDATNNSYYLQVDGGCPINVGDGTLVANQLVWVDYSDGVSTTKINMTLTAGNHTFVLTGHEPNVIVDRVVFAGDPNCVPTGTGDNCAVAPTPTPTPTPTSTTTPTPTPTITPTPTPTPTGNPADLNNDGKVNVFDLSILLSHWGSSGTGDVDGNGTVNVFDLSRLLSAWTG